MTKNQKWLSSHYWARKRKEGLQQATLADEIGVSPGALSEFLRLGRGGYTVTVKVAEYRKRIEEAVNVS